MKIPKTFVPDKCLDRKIEKLLRKKEPKLPKTNRLLQEFREEYRNEIHKPKRKIQYIKVRYTDGRTGTKIVESKW